jgi:hypothetical protein
MWQDFPKTWSTEAPKLFRVDLNAAEFDSRLSRYAEFKGIPYTASFEPANFNAIALDAKGRPVPVMHSDEGFTLLFDTPDTARLKAALAAIIRPFPQGLMTPAGMLVANSALAEPGRYQAFDRTRYHDEVVWSWQQELIAAGIARQLKRSALAGVAVKSAKDACRSAAGNDWYTRIRALVMAL